jgi:hypothetical protein
MGVAHPYVGVLHDGPKALPEEQKRGRTKKIAATTFQTPNFRPTPECRRYISFRVAHQSLWPHWELA